MEDASINVGFSLVPKISLSGVKVSSRSKGGSVAPIALRRNSKEVSIEASTVSTPSLTPQPSEVYRAPTSRRQSFWFPVSAAVKEDLNSQVKQTLKKNF